MSFKICFLKQNFIELYSNNYSTVYSFVYKLLELGTRLHYRDIVAMLMLSLYSLWLLHLDIETLTFFVFFRVNETLIRCRVVIVAKLQHCRVPHKEMWWLIGSAPDFWSRCPGFEFGVSHNDPDAMQDHCVVM